MSKILTIGSDLSIHALYHDFIQEAGHNVALVTNGVESLAKFSE